MNNLAGFADPSVNKRPLILIVDDDPHMFYLIEVILQHDLQIILAINGAEGFEKVLYSKPDLFISDPGMPS